MSTITINKSPSILRDARGVDSVWQRVAAEVSAFFEVVLSPRRVLKQAEQVVALHRQASRVEASDPARAEELRREAARIEF